MILLHPPLQVSETGTLTAAHRRTHMDISERVSAERRAGPRGPLSELCLVLVGSIGCGKTLTADSLLGQSADPGASSRVSQIRRGVSEGRRLSVVETPRWYWRGEEVEAAIQEETRRCLSLGAPGPFVFLILIPIGEFTEVEQRIPDQLERMFGPSVLGHTLVLLTCGEYLMGRSLEQYLRKEEGLREVVRRCRGRCHVISNRRAEDGQQVSALLDKVDEMIKASGGFNQLRGAETHREKQRTEMKLSAAGEPRGRADHQIHTSDERDSGEVVDIRRVNGLQSEQHLPPERSPGFKLSKEGAILSQMMEEEPEGQRRQSFTNTFHHSIKRVCSEGEALSPGSPSSASDALDVSSLPELRLVLLGRSGSGKSAAGNLILGCEAFAAASGSAQRCVKASTVLENTRVSVVDTPDWFQSERSPEEVRAQISSCMSLLAPGPHAFLLCVPLERAAHPELLALKALEGVFGADAVRRHTLVLFTHSDLLPDGATSVDQVEQFITSSRPEMLELVQRCGDRYHVLRRGNTAMKELLEKVQQTVKESGGGFYSGTLYQQIQQEPTAGPRDRQRLRDPSLDTVREAEEEEQERSERLDSAAAAPTLAPSVLRSMWEMTSTAAGRLPKLLAVGALAGAALGVFAAGAAGGAVGAAFGTLLTEVGRRRYNKQKTQ